MATLDALYPDGNVLGLDLGQGPLQFVWRGPEAHLAPHGTTPLEERILLKTNCALVSLIAGCLLISARALIDVPHSRLCVRMAEALLCYEASPTYIRDTFDRQFPDKMPARVEAVRTLCVKSTGVFNASPGDHTNFPPLQPVKNVVALTALVVGPDLRDSFRDWLERAISRLDILAPNPNQTFGTINDYASATDYKAAKLSNMGLPVPIEALDLNIPLVSEELAALYHSFLGAVDHARNPFLADPDTMVEQGFEGRPYGR